MANSKWIKPVDQSSIPSGTFNSPYLWLLLSDGRVVLGYISHKVKNATYDAPYHAWFASENTRIERMYHQGCECWNGAELVAWQYLEAPEA